MKLGRYLAGFSDELTKIAGQPDDEYMQFLTQPGPPISPIPPAVVLQLLSMHKDDYLYWRAHKNSGPYARGGF